MENITSILPAINSEKICKNIEKRIQNFVEKTKTDGIIVGISGGIDSAVTTALAVRAIGKTKVLGLIMPAAHQDPSFENDAQQLANQLGIKTEKIPLEMIMTAIKKQIKQDIVENRVAKGNIFARLRMLLLYAYANHLHYLVVGTSNKSEIKVGYFTKYGDGGADFEPIGDIYKTHLKKIAEYLEIPSQIIQKPPSAGFWKNQTDEKEMGITYEKLDNILYGFEKDFSDKELVKKLGIKLKTVKKVKNMIEKSEHKRKMPPIFKIKIS
ncbi:MAG: NAD+ synthase [Asgard group archaeon]|nr:NAD+ synthase [Asgard group archaeon]